MVYHKKLQTFMHLKVLTNISVVYFNAVDILILSCNSFCFLICYFCIQFRRLSLLPNGDSYYKGYLSPYLSLAESPATVKRVLADL